MLKNAEIFGSVLSGESGYVGGGWRCSKSVDSRHGLFQLAHLRPYLSACSSFNYSVHLLEMPGAKKVSLSHFLPCILYATVMYTVRYCMLYDTVFCRVYCTIL